MGELLGIALALAAFFAISFATTAVVSLIWNALSRTNVSLNLSGRRKADLVFLIRSFPTVFAFGLVTLAGIPSFVIYEPADSGEGIGWKLGSLALLCLAGLTIALVQTIRSWLRTRRMVADWMTTAKPFAETDLAIDAYAIDHAVPMVALVGVFKPRLFVSRNVLELLDQQELRAAIAHEAGHLNARDNLKRGFLAICSQIVLLPVGKDLDESWCRWAEVAADEHAATEANHGAAVSLASALIKIARLMPQGRQRDMAFVSCIESDPQLVSSRIRFLLDGDEFGFGKAGIPFKYIVLALSIAALAVPLIVWQNGSLPAVHDLLERAVSALS